MLIHELQETEKILSIKRSKFGGSKPKLTPFWKRQLAAYAYAQVAQAAKMRDEYVLEGTYFDGNDTKTVEMSGESLSDIVSEIQQSDPNFGLYDMSFDGGWFVADYNVTAQVRSLI